MTIPVIATITRVLWGAVEVLRDRRHRVAPNRSRDKHSALVWDVAHTIELVGIVIGFAGIGRIQSGTRAIESIGLALLFLGIIIRWTAIRRLGKFFTGTVTIKDDHALVRSGPYAHVRHPGYSGLLLAHLGIGMCFSNWFSIALSSIPYFIAAGYRMHIEEQVLVNEFGNDYLDYARQTKRLIPKLY